jgi:DUF971 family protein
MMFEWAKDAEPFDLQWEDDNTTVLVAWNDGHQSRYTLRYLRVICPCALCRDSHANSPIRTDTSADLSNPQLEENLDTLTDEQVALREAYPIGNYALGFSFADGHNDGVYSYRFLRGMCPCSACKSRHQEELLKRSEDGS